MGATLRPATKTITTSTFTRALDVLKNKSSDWDVPVVTLVANTGRDPFRVLISCILSLRTNDKTTAQAVKRLFDIADTPFGISNIPIAKIEKLIFPVGFYRNKARQIKAIARIIHNDLKNRVPDSIEGLLEFDGVGRKTANLVVSEGFDKPAICVDVHVHRICNRMGYIKTKDPHETEFVLRDKLPKKYWKIINAVLVAFGQHACRPLSPHCSICPVHKSCMRVGVNKSR